MLRPQRGAASDQDCVVFEGWGSECVRVGGEQQRERAETEEAGTEGTAADAGWSLTDRQGGRG